jgi:outer membrane protein TolC
LLTLWAWPIPSAEAQPAVAAEEGDAAAAEAGPATPADASEAQAPSTAAKVATIEAQLAALMGKPGGLTAATAATRASNTSIDVRARGADVDAAEAETARVIYTSLPRLNLLARYTRLSGIGDQAFGPDSGALVVTSDPPGPLGPGAPLIGVPASAFAFPEVLNQYLLQASVTVPLTDYLLSTGSATDAAHENERSARFNREAARLQVANQAKLLYYEWVRTRLQVVVAQQSVDQARAGLERARTAFTAGRVSKTDILNAESVLATAELRVESAQSQAALAQARLRVIMHDPPNTRYEIGEDLFKPASNTPRQDIQALLTEARRKRVEFKALDAANSSLSNQATVSDVRGLPKLEAFGNAYYARPNQRFVPVQDEWRATWDVGVQLSWSPNDLGASGSDTRTLEAERMKVLAQKAALTDRIQEEILRAYTSLREAELGAATAQRNLEAAEEAYRVQRVFYENGRATSFELLDSETRLLQARVDIVNLRVARHMAQVALAHAVGRDVP